MRRRLARGEEEVGGGAQVMLGDGSREHLVAEAVDRRDAVG